MAVYTIEVDDSELEEYDSLFEERRKLKIDIDKRIALYKGKPKAISKDMFYKEAVYNSAMGGIKMTDIKDKIFGKVYSEWMKKKNP